MNQFFFATSFVSDGLVNGSTGVVEGIIHHEGVMLHIIVHLTLVLMQRSNPYRQQYPGTVAIARVEVKMTLSKKTFHTRCKIRSQALLKDDNFLSPLLGPAPFIRCRGGLKEGISSHCVLSAVLYSYLHLWVINQYSFLYTQTPPTTRKKPNKERPKTRRGRPSVRRTPFLVWTCFYATS